MTSAGVRNPSDFLGRFLSSSAAWVKYRCEYSDQPVPLGEILPQQAVGILVRGASPRAMRVREIHPNPDSPFQILMLGRLLASVIGQ